MKKHHELLLLAGSLCNGELSALQKNRLEELLDGDPEAQETYRQYMAMHAELYWQQGACNDDSDCGVTTTVTHAARRSWLQKAMWPLAIAASLLVGAFVGLYGGANGLGERLSAIKTNDIELSETVTPVAKVTGSRNCKWVTNPDAGFDPVGYGSPLYAGQRLELKEGLAEITFNAGACIILEAPAVLTVETIGSSSLLQGRLTASIPDGSEGFKVNVNGLTLVDHGTEFGVMADKAGNAEVHVFDGVLEGRFRNQDGVADRTVMWTSEQAVRIDPYHKRIRELIDSDLKFVRTLAPPFGPSNGLLVKEDFDYPSAPLADQNGGFGWGGPWQEIASDGNLSRINRVAAESLKYIGLSNSGNHARLEGQFNRIRRVLSTSFGGVFDSAGLVEAQDGARLVGKDNTTVYLSFTQQISKTDEVFYGFELNRGDGNRNRVLCIGHAAAEKWTVGPPRAPIKEAGVTGWAVTSEFNGETNRLLNLGDLGPETTETVFFVVKISYGENNEDKIEVFKNPASLLDESQCEPVVTGYGNFSFDRVSLANFEGNKTFSVDHIRFGTNFPAVTRHQWDSNSLAKVVTRIPASE